jgi:hypothetical protein
VISVPDRAGYSNKGQWVGRNLPELHMKSDLAMKTAIFLAAMMLALVAWGGGLENGATQIMIDGEELTNPLKGAAEIGGLLIASIALFSAATFLVFFATGVGIFLLGIVIVGALAVAAAMFPVLLVVLVPWAIIWSYIATMTSLF